MIVVMMVPTKKEFKIEVSDMFTVQLEQFLHGCASITLEVPKGSIEVKKEMLICFQNERPIFFIPNATEDNAMLQRKNAMIIFGRALGLCL
jgi:hypothetical protein